MTKILLVEDDKSLREIYGVRLLAEGYDIVSAGDGEEALAMAIKERPELIVSDVMMPKISGFDMLDILRSTTETKNIKVIMMTALSSEDQRARGQALGADRYLVKSQVGIEDVVRTVHEVLKDAPVASGPSSFSSAAPRPNTPPPSRPAPPASATLSRPAIPPQSSNLPQPTAPFSGSRPANLGERVIHPISTTQPSTDLGTRMSQELQEGSIPSPAAPIPSNSVPVIPPPPPVPPSAQVTPPPPPATPSTTPPIQFEETPLPPAVDTPPPNKAP